METSGKLASRNLWRAPLKTLPPCSRVAEGGAIRLALTWCPSLRGQALRRRLAVVSSEICSRPSWGINSIQAGRLQYTHLLISQFDRGLASLSGFPVLLGFSAWSPLATGMGRTTLINPAAEPYGLGTSVALRPMRTFPPGDCRGLQFQQSATQHRGNRHWERCGC